MSDGCDFTFFGNCYVWEFDPIENIKAANEIVNDAYIQGVGGALHDAYVASEDPLGNLVDNFTWPEQAILSVLGVSCQRPTAPAGNQRPDTPPVIINDPVPLSQREFLRDIPYDQYADDGGEDFSSQGLGACMPGFNQGTFDFWGYGVKDARLFHDNRNWFMELVTDDDGWISAWRVYNPYNDPVVCGNYIWRVDKWYTWEDTASAVGLNDDNSNVWRVIKELERCRTDNGIPGPACAWDSDLIYASQFFDDTTKLIRHHQNVRQDWLSLFRTTFTNDFLNPTPQQEALADLFQGLIAETTSIITSQNLDRDAAAAQITALLENVPQRIIELYTDSPSRRDLVEQELAFQFAAAGVRNRFNTDWLAFNYTWRYIDMGGPENRPPASHDSDPFTPLIRAASLYHQMVVHYQKQYDLLIAKLDEEIWEVVEDEDGTLLIVQHDKLDPDTNEPFTISVADYANDFIWRKPGENHETVRTALLTEINSSVIRSQERCRYCSDDHYWIKELLKYIGYMNDGIPFDVAPRMHAMDELRRRARPRETHTADECCHMEPPRFFDEAARRCNTELTAYEVCYQMEPPRMYEAENCACTAEAGATICLNREPPRTHIFVFNPETGRTECVRCEPPTPITRDGLECIRRERVSTRPPPQEDTPPVLPRCSFTQIQAGLRGTQCQ